MGFIKAGGGDIFNNFSHDRTLGTHIHRFSVFKGVVSVYSFGSTCLVAINSRAPFVPKRRRIGRVVS